MAELTKKECIEAYDNLYWQSCELEEMKTGVDNVCCLYDEDLEKIKELINEHFDNPPLKFDEIELDMLIFEKGKIPKFVLAIDKENKIIAYVSRSNYTSLNKIDTQFVKFEENRFYRKRVEE
mgnify:CR=1 FL=1